MVTANEMEVGAIYRPTRGQEGCYYKRTKRTFEQWVKRHQKKFPLVSCRESWLLAFYRSHPEAVLAYRYHRGTCGLNSGGGGSLLLGTETETRTIRSPVPHGPHP